MLKQKHLYKLYEANFHLWYKSKQKNNNNVGMDLSEVVLSFGYEIEGLLLLCSEFRYIV